MRRWFTLILLAQATHGFIRSRPPPYRTALCSGAACVLQLGGLFDAFKSPTGQALAQARKDPRRAARGGRGCRRGPWRRVRHGLTGAEPDVGASAPRWPRRRRARRKPSWTRRLCLPRRVDGQLSIEDKIDDAKGGAAELASRRASALREMREIDAAKAVEKALQPRRRRRRRQRTSKSWQPRRCEGQLRWQPNRPRRRRRRGVADRDADAAAVAEERYRWARRWSATAKVSRRRRRSVRRRSAWRREGQPDRGAGQGGGGERRELGSAVGTAPMEGPSERRRDQGAKARGGGGGRGEGGGRRGGGRAWRHRRRRRPRRRRRRRARGGGDGGGGQGQAGARGRAAAKASERREAVVREAEEGRRAASAARGGAGGARPATRPLSDAPPPPRRRRSARWAASRRRGASWAAEQKQRLQREAEAKEPRSRLSLFAGDRAARHERGGG